MSGPEPDAWADQPSPAARTAVGTDVAPAISAVLHTDDYRGDHAADVVIALEVDPSTTVGDLCRALTRGGDSAFNPPKHRFEDHIELRLIRPAP